MRAASLKGGVCNGLEEPKIATCGTPSAAATCIRPESLLTIHFAAAMAENAPARDVTCQIQAFTGLFGIGWHGNRFTQLKFFA